MSISRTPRTRFYGDFTEDEFSLSMEGFLNGAYYPKHGIMLARASRLTEHETGRSGELVSITPFYIAYRTPSLVSDSGESLISKSRMEKRVSPGGFCFPLQPDNQSVYAQHNALFHLSRNVRAFYLLPLFIRRRAFTFVKAEQTDDITGFSQKRSSRYSSQLLKESAVITPHSLMERSDDLFYYSINHQGEIVFHGTEPERISQKSFLAQDMITQILSDKNGERDAVKWTDTLFEMLPDLFSLTASARKYKFILESVIAEHLDEAEIASPTINKMLDALSVYEKLVVIEKIMRRYLGITQYISLSFRN
jgi:hypothetical protein